MRFVDEARIKIRSGKGGAGSTSFRREKFVPKGGPDGGDGGRGGDVIFYADPKMHTLYDFTHKRQYAAENGRPGMGRQKFGRAGQDLYIHVPLGTLIFAVSDKGEDILLADLSSENQEYKAVSGGRGGKGNVHFKSSTMRTPRFAQPGEDGSEKDIKLVLKIIADIGLIGLPNAGKSTLIANVSAARPKIAAYPFTTITPNLGVVLDKNGNKMTLADIPGLIEGAHQGHGLGDRFLKHVERTKILVHVLSVEDYVPDDPKAGFELINQELVSFDPGLAEKKQILVLNKIDLVPEEDMQEIARNVHDRGLNLHFISALDGTGLDDLLCVLWEELSRASAE
ncbi:MAG: GTPase ObgE [Thermodesulfobacteriota bacterium]